MIKALYTEREDGDWDFVCAFDGEHAQSQEWVEQVREYLEGDGETVLTMQYGDAGKIVDVLVTPDNSTLDIVIAELTRNDGIGSWQEAVAVVKKMKACSANEKGQL